MYGPYGFLHHFCAQSVTTQCHRSVCSLTDDSWPSRLEELPRLPKNGDAKENRNNPFFEATEWIWPKIVSSRFFAQPNIWPYHCPISDHRSHGILGVLILLNQVATLLLWGAIAMPVAPPSTAELAAPGCALPHMHPIQPPQKPTIALWSWKKKHFLPGELCCHLDSWWKLSWNHQVFSWSHKALLGVAGHQTPRNYWKQVEVVGLLPMGQKEHVSIG